MKLEELKTGMIVTFRNGDELVVSNSRNGDLFFANPTTFYWARATGFNSDLTSQFSRNEDIVKIEIPLSPYNQEEKSRITLWERELKIIKDFAAGNIIQGKDFSYKILEHFANGTTFVIPTTTMMDDKMFDRKTSDYKYSSIRKQIESKCQAIFEDDFGKDNLVEHEVDLTTVNMQRDFGSICCKVALPTFDETRKYIDLLFEENVGSFYWTCTSWASEKRGKDSKSVALFESFGTLGFSYCNRPESVRPICLLKSNTVVSK